MDCHSRPQHVTFRVEKTSQKGVCMDKIKTGELIKNKRIEKGYTQLELEDLLGVSNKAVSRWENGDSSPDIGILGWLCYQCRSCKESLNPFCTKQNGLLASLSLLNFFGTIASLCTVLFTLKRKIALLFLPDKSLGPACFYLLVALFCISLVLLAVSLWKYAFREEAFRLDVYVTVATLHLILRYNDMLHTLTSVYTFQMTFLFDTGIVVFLTAVAIGVTALINSVNRRAAIK